MTAQKFSESRLGAISISFPPSIWEPVCCAIINPPGADVAECVRVEHRVLCVCELVWWNILSQFGCQWLGSVLVPPQRHNQSVSLLSTIDTEVTRMVQNEDFFEF